MADQNLLFVIGALVTLISVTFIGYTKIKKSKALKKQVEEPKKD